MPTDDAGDYLSTAEVARRLDVKPETVYAYVSRGVLTSVRLPRRPGSWFAEDAVETLVRRGRERSGKRDPLNRITTHLTVLENDDLFYRGRAVTDLARGESFEAVARLLWTGELTDGPPFTLPEDTVAVIRRAVDVLPAGAALPDMLRTALTVLSAGDPLRFDLDPRAVARSGAAMVAGMVATLGTGVDGSVADRLWPALSPHAAQPMLLNAALVLLADHDLAISTVAARVAASARAHPYAVVAAGLGALDGPYHGAASATVHRFLAGALLDPRAALSAHLRSDQRVPGFGHVVYEHVDPRAELLLELLRASGSGHDVLAVVDTLVEEQSGRDGAVPNVDLALAAIMLAFDMKPDAGEAIFAIARTAGWLAHALEEYQQPPLRFRPTGLYVGPPPLR